MTVAELISIFRAFKLLLSPAAQPTAEETERYHDAKMRAESGVFGEEGEDDHR
jgi:hypothetical protein